MSSTFGSMPSVEVGMSQRVKREHERIGITSSVPVEVLYAARMRPVDLNNAFINDPEAARTVEDAEELGLPRNVCAWVKGIFEVARRDEKMKQIIAVTQGDCTNVRALVELWRRDGKEVIPFSYPYDRDAELLDVAIAKLRSRFGVTVKEVDRMKARLDRIRCKLRELDRLTWKLDKVNGRENHEWIISGSDFRGDPDAFETGLDAFLKAARKRDAVSPRFRIGLIGIPPIWSDFFDYLEARGARVVYNELARQFALLSPAQDIVTQYLRYTYPYDARGRVRDIRTQVRQRRLAGIIHNVQSFCYHQIEDVVLRENLGVPTVLVEGDRPGALDPRTSTRLDSFLSVLSHTS